MVEAGQAATLDGLQKELAIQERLDGMIDKQVKRLMSVKALKSILRRHPHAAAAYLRTPASRVTALRNVRAAALN